MARKLTALKSFSIRAPILVAVILMLSCMEGRDASAQKPDQERIHVKSELVTLSVTVKDDAGNLVADLRREQFHLLDDDVEQGIDVFAEESLPLSLVLLVDNDLNGKEGVQVVQSLRALLAGLSLQDRAMLCRFDMLFYPGESFSSDGDALMTAVKSAQAEIKPTPKYVPEPVVCGNSTSGSPCIAAPTYSGSRPSKALDDAVFSSAELLQGESADNRKIILLVSDGANEAKLNKHDFESVKRKLLEENISIFSLAIGSDAAKARFARMEKYSEVSGGDIYFASKSRAMEQIYSRLTEEARHQYSLAYVPIRNKPGANYHRIKLTVDRRGLTVQTREGYFADR
jgi:VWFA-related protein